MGRDRLGSSSGHETAEEPLERGNTPGRASIFSRLAQLARVAVLATLGLGLAILSIEGDQQAPLNALVAPAAAPVVAQPVAAPEAQLAYAEVATPSQVASTPAQVSDSPALSAEAPTAVAEAVELAADAPAADLADAPAVDLDELLRELRPQLSARGGSRAVEASLVAEQATELAPAKQEMTTSSGIKAAPKTPAPTKTPTHKTAPAKTPTPKRVATRTPTPRPTTTTSYSSTLGQRVVSIALRYVGYRYTYGGTSPSTGFDCSGFTYYVYKAAGHPISRSIYTQYRTGAWVSRSSLRPGDLVFFQNTYKAGLSHASIYIGSGRIVHAQSESTGVTTSSLSSTYWSSHYLGARRP